MHLYGQYVQQQINPRPNQSIIPTFSQYPNIQKETIKHLSTRAKDSSDLQTLMILKNKGVTHINNKECNQMRPCNDEDLLVQ